MRKEAGFTLVELLIVIAVLGILIVIAIPLFGAYLDMATLRTDQANLRTLNTMSDFYRVVEGGSILNESRLQQQTAIDLQKDTLVAANYLTEPIEAKMRGQYSIGCMTKKETKVVGCIVCFNWLVVLLRVST